MSRKRGRHSTRRAVLLVVVACLALLLGACGKKSDRGPVPGLPARTYRMGFTSIPPRPDFTIAVQALELWTRRADAALHHVGAPWDSLLAGVLPETLATREILPIVNYYRSKGLRIVVSLDPTNGLDRSSDAPELVALGRSLTEPSIQALFRSWCVG